MDKKITYELVARYFSGNSSDSEKLTIENWRDSSNSNRDAYKQYQTIWEKAKQTNNAFTPDIENALQQVNQKITANIAKPKYGSVRKMLEYSRQIAAAILIGVGIWLAYYWIHPNKENHLLIAASGNFRKEIILSDGTHICLNTNSVLHYPSKFEGPTRKISIEGEAYFDVAKNRKHPFVIETQQSIVTVVGTEFNLRARKNELITAITVTEGKVSFAAKNSSHSKPVYLLAGDKGLLHSSKKEIILEKNQEPNFLAWKTGILTFKNTPLEKVASDLSEYYKIRILVSDSKKAKTPFTSTFNHQSLKDILTIMEMSLGIKADTTNQTVYLK